MLLLAALRLYSPRAFSSTRFCNIMIVSPCRAHHHVVQIIPLCSVMWGLHREVTEAGFTHTNPSQFPSVIQRGFRFLFSTPVAGGVQRGEIARSFVRALPTARWHRQ